MVQNDELFPLAIGGLADLVLKTAVSSSSHIEGEYSSGLSRFFLKRRFSECDFQSLVAEFSIVLLHYIDRVAFRILSQEQRHEFMDALLLSVNHLGCNQPMNEIHRVPAFVSERSPGITVCGLSSELYTLRVNEYRELKDIPGEGEPQLTGTLGGEFGKYISQICDKYGLVSSKIQFLANVLVLSAFPHLIALTSEVVTALFKSTDSS